MIFSAHERMLHDLAETKRKQATSDRMGTVKEVKQEGGEQKIRVEYGVDPKGKPLVGPWMNTTDKRGATREQHQYKKGQNVRMSGDDYRQATVTAWSEGDSFPQPDNAKDHGYGDSYQAGKFHQGKWLPEDDEKKDSAGGTSTGGGGSQGGQQKQQEEKNHRYETWIAKEDNKPPAHSGESKSTLTSGGETGSMPKDQKPGEKKEEKKIEEAMMQSIDEKNGFTQRIGKGESAVRVAAHPEGAKMAAGKTYYSAKKDDDAIMNTEKELYNKAKKNMYYKVEEGSPYINKPWQIKDKEKKDAVPNDDQLGNKKSGGGKGGK